MERVGLGPWQLKPRPLRTALAAGTVREHGPAAAPGALEPSPSPPRLSRDSLGDGLAGEGASGDASMRDHGRGGGLEDSGSRPLSLEGFPAVQKPTLCT